ncbi:MAG: AbrB/MazE/SpoVT family DNA-binding domain-containing protein [Defluviitaleaceae bacterium]|nr:AbrB/MazE/SpoVT family DNA-binding domain-containing protein [Defluviitaleaceae bacterium]
MQNKITLGKMGEVSISEEMMTNAGFQPDDLIEIEIKDSYQKAILMRADENSKKIMRTIDGSGRVILPIEVRKALRYETYDILDITIENIIVLCKKMKKNGVEKQDIDSLGRIVIPKKIRDSIGYEDGNEFEFGIRNGKLILSKAEENSSKITKPVDPKGRVVLPVDIRRSLGFEEGDALEIRVERILVVSKEEK